MSNGGLMDSHTLGPTTGPSSKTAALATILALLLCSSSAPAQGPAFLVKDINTQGESANPFGFTEINGTLVFAADDGNAVRAGPDGGRDALSPASLWIARQC
jgi:hypothetical protein